MGRTLRLSDRDANQLNAISGAARRHRLGWRLMALGMDTSKNTYLTLLDNETVRFGTGTQTADTTNFDVKMLFNASNLQMLPYSDDLCAFQIGNGTLDMDFKVFCGTTTNYITTNVDTTGSTGQAGASGGKFRVRTTEAAELATGAYAGIYSTYEITATQSNNTSQFSIWGELYMTGDLRHHTNSAGVWGHVELTDGGGALHIGTSGTNTAPAGFSAAVAASILGSDGVNINSDHVICGVRSDSGLHASTTLGGFSVGLEISKTSAGLAWSYGIRMHPAAVSNGLLIGNSGTSMTLATYANHAIEIYTTSASTDGSNSVQPIYMKSTMAGVGGVGGRACFHTYANVALGTWCNGLKGLMEFGSSGRTTGLASAVCAEMILSAGTTGTGNYCALEAELIANVEVATGVSTGFLFCNVGGTNTNGKATINSDAYFLIFGELVTMGTNDDTAIVTSSHADGVQTHQVRCRAPDGSNLWLMATTELASS